MIEVERKFRLSAERYDKIVKLLHVQEKASEVMKQIDEVYLYKIDSFRHFKQGDPVMRIRTVNGASQLTLKRRIDATGDSIEYELTIGSAHKMRAILLELQFQLVTKVEKERIEVKRDDITIALDKVQGLGLFLEIEALGEQSERVGLERRILEKAKKMGLTAEDIESKKYDQLLAFQ